MAYFPFFVDLEGVPGLIVGSGRMARRKIEKLTPYGPRLTVAAPVIPPELRAVPGLTFWERDFSPDMVEGMAFVISAAGSREGNHAVSLACKARNIPVNTVDGKDDCTFLFPALVKDGPLSVGISTSGTCPTAAVWLKEQVNGLLPERFGESLAALGALRPDVLSALPEQRDRAAFFGKLFALCMENREPLDRAAMEALLAEARREAEG